MRLNGWNELSRACVPQQVLWPERDRVSRHGVLAAPVAVQPYSPTSKLVGILLTTPVRFGKTGPLMTSSAELQVTSRPCASGAMTDCYPAFSMLYLLFHARIVAASHGPTNLGTQGRWRPASEAAQRTRF